MHVTETFISVEVADMQRASAFYVAALEATVAFATPLWSSLFIARVRIGLFHQPAHRGARTGLHFAVSDLEQALREIERAGGRTITRPMEAAPGVFIAEAADTEGNSFSLRRA